MSTMGKVLSLGAESWCPKENEGIHAALKERLHGSKQGYFLICIHSIQVSIASNNILLDLLASKGPDSSSSISKDHSSSGPHIVSCFTTLAICMTQIDLEVSPLVMAFAADPNCSTKVRLWDASP